MTARVHRWFISAVTLLGLIALGLLGSQTTAHADLGPKVIKAFKGQIIVSAEPVDTGSSDKEAIANYKAAKLSKIEGTPNADDVTAWQFHYTAFLKKKGFTDLSLEFHVNGKYVADRRLTGVDPKLTVLQGDIQITEDDGPAKGKKYTLKLVGQSKGKDVVVATTTLTMD